MMKAISSYILIGLAFFHLWEAGQYHLHGDTEQSLFSLLLAIFFMLADIARALREGRKEA